MSSENHAPADTQKAMFLAGEAVRREVLGDDHVDRSWARASDLTRPLQEFVTEFCWGGIWTRPGLERRTRSLLNIAMLAALGKGDELRAHVKGAIRNGSNRDEVMEVILQAAVYCGMPAGLEAARHVQAAIEELER